MQREDDHDNGCATPKHCQTPAKLVCPPPPKKNKYSGEVMMKKRDPPKNGYFSSPELDRFLAIACAGRPVVFNN